MNNTLLAKVYIYLTLQHILMILFLDGTPFKHQEWERTLIKMLFDGWEQSFQREMFVVLNTETCQGYWHAKRGCTLSWRAKRSVQILLLVSFQGWRIMEQCLGIVRNRNIENKMKMKWKQNDNKMKMKMKWKQNESKMKLKTKMKMKTKMKEYENENEYEMFEATETPNSTITTTTTTYRSSIKVW